MLVLGGLVLLVVVGAIQSAYLAGLLDIANGQPVTAGSFFKPRNVGSVVIAAVIIGILTAIGNFLCVIPGLIVGILTIFTTVAIVDPESQTDRTSIKASFELAKGNFVQVLLTWLLVDIITAVGALACGIGLLVSVPVATLSPGLLLAPAHRRTGRAAHPIVGSTGGRPGRKAFVSHRVAASSFVVLAEVALPRSRSGSGDQVSATDTEDQRRR